MGQITLINDWKMVLVGLHLLVVLIEKRAVCVWTKINNTPNNNKGSFNHSNHAYDEDEEALDSTLRPVVSILWMMR